MERELHLSWVNFWPEFLTAPDEASLKVQELFTRLLFPNHRVVITRPERAEIVVSSVFGSSTLPQDKVKVLFLGENWPVSWGNYDYSFSHRLEGSLEGCTNFTFPLFALWPNLQELLYPPLEVDLDSKGFCSFMVSNPNCSQRNNFFDRLSSYRRISSAGRHLNNIGGPLPGGHSSGNALRFLSQHRFNICFENSIAPGYNTEKLVQAMAAGTLPIYWGAESVKEYFSPSSFLSLNEDGNNLESLLLEVKALEEDRQKYIQRLYQARILESTVASFSSAAIARMGQRILNSL